MPAQKQDFAAFVTARSRELLRLAWMLTGDAGKAEDLLQESLARAWPHWNRIRSDDPDQYVRRIMVHLATAWGRRRWRHEVPTGYLTDAPTPDAIASADERDRIRRALAKIPARQRAVVVLRYYEDLSEEQVASLLGCSLGTVKSQAARGLQSLRASLPTIIRETS